eukprot:CAMPEP_0171492532 /NCGR_PEP_ID=MMETSP0958-20121227/4463_1 /TAXON_ID=87120 /ORGANISM="Aurantiochytrium limacinum, Strain ATCCMYA-1381" /LENGTH=114 /DNA_ID=CAMNT_0012026063 /DNA_START=618 /DNA_END=962 /DNA_ORIENTATION=+
MAISKTDACHFAVEGMNLMETGRSACWASRGRYQLSVDAACSSARSPQSRRAWTFPAASSCGAFEARAPSFKMVPELTQGADLRSKKREETAGAVKSLEPGAHRARSSRTRSQH